jgi:hypothetical protein
MTICDTCDFAAPSIRCGHHSLMSGIVRELHQAMLSGQSWGDILYDAEMDALEMMSAAEKATLEKKKAAEEVERKKSVVDYTVSLRKKLYTSADGLAKRKFNRMCKKERYDGGCFLHNEKHGACSFIHTDERATYMPIFASFGMKMVDDAAYFTLLKKADAASGDVKWKMEKDCDAMEQTLKREARCLFVTGVDATGNLIFMKSNPEHSDSRSNSSGGSHPNSARSSNGFRGQPLLPAPQSTRYWAQKTDNSAW